MPRWSGAAIASQPQLLANQRTAAPERSVAWQDQGANDLSPPGSAKPPWSGCGTGYSSMLSTETLTPADQRLVAQRPTDQRLVAQLLADQRLVAQLPADQRLVRLLEV